MAMMADFHSEDRIAWHLRKAQLAISELLANEAYGIFCLIEVDGQSIGFLVLTFGFSLEFQGRVAFVDEFYIRPEFRGQGIGARVLHQMIGYCGWRDLILRLAADFRCICFDAPGNGRSTPVPGSAASLDFASRAVRQVIEELDLNDLTLILHDLGGPAGIAGARRIPQRVCGIVAMNAFGWQPAGAALRGMLSVMGSSVVREMDA
jgi:GNAT superfamily N-acetyltransferase